MVTNMPIKVKVKIFKISLVISILRFGVWGFGFEVSGFNFIGIFVTIYCAFLPNFM